jgi:hypothetical protein
MMMWKNWKIRRARRGAEDLTFEEASELFHGLVAFEIDMDLEVLAVIAERAHDTSPNQETADRFRAYRNALRAGHRVKIGTYPVFIEYDGGWTGVAG